MLSFQSFRELRYGRLLVARVLINDPNGFYTGLRNRWNACCFNIFSHELFLLLALKLIIYLWHHIPSYDFRQLQAERPTYFKIVDDKSIEVDVRKLQSCFNCATQQSSWLFILFLSSWRVRSFVVAVSTHLIQLHNVPHAVKCVGNNMTRAVFVWRWQDSTSDAISPRAC